MEAKGTRWSRIFPVFGIGVPLVVVVLLAWTPGISFQEDLGRHLLLGKIIIQSRSVPDTNLLSYTHPEYPFINHHWLSEVALYLLHRMGGLNGLIVWKMIMMGGALALALLATPPRRGWGLYAMAGILAAVLLGFRSHIRPELFTYVSIAFFLWSFECIRAGKTLLLWVMPVVMLAWVNLHIYFLFGLGMALAFALERAWCAWRNPSESEGARTTWVWLAVLLAVCLIHPRGWSGLLYPLRIFQDYGMSITENESPLDYWRAVVNPMLLALPFFSLLVLAAGGIALARFVASRDVDAFRPANWAIALAALAASWTMARSVPLLALAGLPALGSVLRVEGRRPPLGWRLAGLATTTMFGLWLSWGIIDGWYARRFPSPIAPTPFGFDDAERYERLGQFARSVHLKGPVFSDYNIGSLVEYALYPEPGYVDNRPEAFPSAFWRAEYLPALALGERWAVVCAERRINAVIVSLTGVKEGFTQEMMRRPEWVLVYLDDQCGVWVRNHVDNKNPIDAAVFNEERLERFIADTEALIDSLPGQAWWRKQVEAERAVYRCYSLICVGHGDRVWPMVKRLHECYPDYQIIHELMRVTVPPDQIDRVESVMRQRARWPVAAKQALDYGAFLSSQDRTGEALRVFRRGLRFFPLSGPLREAVETLDDAKYVDQTFSSSDGEP